MGDLSEHFSRHEFACKGTRHTAHAEVDRELVGRLELLRKIVGGKPLRIVSGVRCAAHNTAVGGARYSQHLFGRGADIPEGYATVTQAEQAGFKGIGSAGPWAVHVDTRARRARWRYR